MDIVIKALKEIDNFLQGFAPAFKALLNHILNNQNSS